MIAGREDLARVRNPVLLVTLVAWVWLLADPGGSMTSAHPTSAHPMGGHGGASHSMSLSSLSIAGLAVGWASMLAAMMAPALIPPILHLRLRALARRRWRTIGLFVAGYFAVWMALGGIFIGFVRGLGEMAPAPWVPALVVVAVALVWQASPLKQRCLNRCHSHRPVAVWGSAADLDALRVGVAHGMWCASSCWALMLVPMVLHTAHLAAMAVVTLIIVGERLEHPQPPRWAWRGTSVWRRLAIHHWRVRWLSPRRSAHRLTTG